MAMPMITDPADFQRIFDYTQGISNNPQYYKKLTDTGWTWAKRDSSGQPANKEEDQFTPRQGADWWQNYQQPTWNPEPYIPSFFRQGMDAMNQLPNLVGNSFAFVNALNSANKQAYDQTVAPIQLQREKNEMISNTMSPLLAALIGGIGNAIGGGGMTGFADTASRQMAELPTGSAAKPVRFR